MPPLPENTVHTVSSLTRALKALVEPAFAEIWVQGETSNFRRQSSGHLYFSLKDGDCQLACVMFAAEAARLRFPVQDGQQLVAFGRIALYEPRGQYQLVVRLLVDSGRGPLQQRFEQLKERLAAEGLFAPERKRPLPVLPPTVGFVTSPTGAALQDFLRILQRRGWRGRLLVLPARVQGEGAAEEIAAMVELANRERLCELLVVGRGGGSLEDLWPFNEERAVRAVAASSIPVISAVGHEIDFALTDFAADVRAETPSAAAELISSLFLAFTERTARARLSRERAWQLQRERRRNRLELLRRQLAVHSPLRVLEKARQQLDDLQQQLSERLRQELLQRREAQRQLRERLERRAPQSRLALAQERLRQIRVRLQAADPDAVLRRGYVILRDGKGRILSRSRDLRAGQVVRASFADGTRSLRAEAEQTELPLEL